MNIFKIIYKLNRKEGISVISASDLFQLKFIGYTSEDLFNHLNEYYQSLLHGSRRSFDSPIRPSKLTSRKRKMFGSEYGTFATTFGSIALLKAILSNEGSNLKYSYIQNENQLLDVKIEDINQNKIGEFGFVYVINNVNGFKNGLLYEQKRMQRNISADNWIEWVKAGNEPVNYNVQIAVEKSDFTYPIFDVTNNKRIQ